MNETKKYNVFLLIPIFFLIIEVIPYFKEQTKLIQFILFSSFSWISYINKANGNKGEMFFFIILALLFNPFYTLKVQYDNEREIAFCTLLILSFYLIHKNSNSFVKITTRLKSFNYTLNRSQIIKVLISFSILTLLILIFRFTTKTIQEKKEKVEQERQDSIKRIEFANKIKMDAINSSLYCTEEMAIKNFKDYLDFYYPEWKIISKPKIKSDDYCKFKISMIVKESKQYYSFNYPLVIEINMNADGNFKKYNVQFIDRPPGM